MCSILCPGAAGEKGWIFGQSFLGVSARAAGSGRGSVLRLLRPSRTEGCRFEPETDPYAVPYSAAPDAMRAF